MSLRREEEDRMQNKHDVDRELFLQLNTTLIFVSRLLKLFYIAVQVVN